MEITTIGLDLAKSVFQLHAVDATGAVVWRRKLRRSALLPELATGWNNPWSCRSFKLDRLIGIQPADTIRASGPFMPHKQAG